MATDNVQLDDTPAEDANAARQAAALKMFDTKLAILASQEKDRVGRQNMWLAHHWPDDYTDRCVKLGRRHVCRRCGSLYPLGILIAFLSAGGLAPWPVTWDPGAIWLLCLPATIAYCGEAVGLFGYNPRVQVATTLVTAVAFGRALGYEFLERWSPEFWGPVAVFGGIWFLATMIGLTRSRLQA